MKNYYTEIVPFEIAVMLYEAGAVKTIEDDYYYALTDLEITYDNFLGSEKIAKGDTFYMVSGENYHGKYIPAYTYAEVIDWLMEKGIFIQMEPWYTYALKERMGFVYEINMVNEEKAQIDSEVWNDFASFGLCIEEAVKKAIEMLNDKNNGQG